MDIFVRRLPVSTTRLDLIQFASDALEPQWHLLEFSPIGKLKGCEIVRITDSSLTNAEYHGLLHIEPSKAGLAVIDRLNGSLFKNKKVDVRKFYKRSSERDRRHNDVQPLPLDILEQRKGDRRRNELVFKKLRAGATT
ncbi:MAG: RNA-binding protein [Candidatus Sedimenticola sp. (ex Thyasira tokunagai)]